MGLEGLAPKGGSEGWGPEGGRAQNLAFFSLSRPPISLFFFSQAAGVSHDSLQKTPPTFYEKTPVREKNDMRRPPEREKKAKIGAGEGKKREILGGGPAEGGPATTQHTHTTHPHNAQHTTDTHKK